MSEVINWAKECLSCPKPMCQSGCPLDNHIRDYIKSVKEEDVDKAGEILHGQNPFPELTSWLCDCARQCRGHCVKGVRFSPVEIQSIERYIAFHTKRDLSHPALIKHCALIGAGPANLSLAYYLTKGGYRVEIYERQSFIGGAILSGIPYDRFDKDILKSIYDDLCAMDVQFHFNQNVDEELFEQLRQKHPFIVVSIGAQLENNPFHQEIDGIQGGLHFLENYNHHADKCENIENVLVWGGGNVAMDCARSLKHLYPNVSVVYRRDLPQMPANREEIEAAQLEGVSLRLLENIVQPVVEEGRLSAVTTVKMVLGEKGEDGRASFKEIEGSQSQIPCDLLVLAIGQKVDLSALHPQLQADEDYKTNLDHVYVCGDAHLGPKTVAAAIGDGRKLAAYLLMQYGGE